MKREQVLFKSALMRLLKPIVRMALRNQITHRVFDEWVKSVFIDVAEKDFAIEGKKVSDSRVSLLTGLTRKDIRRIKQADDLTHETYEKYHRCTKIISAWRREPRYSDSKGEPKVLELYGAVSFDSLVKENGKDVPTKAVLDELLHAKMIELQEEKVLLLQDSYMPEEPSSELQLHILGQDVEALAETIDHNTYRKIGAKRFQRHVRYVGIPEQVLPKFEKMLEKKGQLLLEDLDQWLSEQCEKDISHKSRVVLVGLYYHEEKANELD